jgi:hypothetical protein
MANVIHRMFISVLLFGFVFGMTAIVSAQDEPDDPCAGLMTPRLAVNQQAQILIVDWPNLNMRSDPGLATTVIRVIPNESIVTVIDGPACGPDGVVWWLVSYAGRQGWVAESDGSFYLIQLVGEAVEPTEPEPPPIVEAEEVCPGLLPTRLGINRQAQVQIIDWPNLNQRDEPGLASTPIGPIPNEAVVTVADGPACGPDNIVWWLVDYEGRRGWAAEHDGAFYLLRPVE